MNICSRGPWLAEQRHFRPLTQPHLLGHRNGSEPRNEPITASPSGWIIPLLIPERSCQRSRSHAIPFPVFLTDSIPRLSFIRYEKNMWNRQTHFQCCELFKCLGKGFVVERMTLNKNSDVWFPEFHLDLNCVFFFSLQAKRTSLKYD